MAAGGALPGPARDYPPTRDTMVNSEQEMLHEKNPEPPPERFTSLQPTYEDSVPPNGDDWELDE